MSDGTDAVEPVVCGAEVAAGVADYWDVDGFEGVEDVGAEAGGVYEVGVGVAGVVDTAVNAAAHVLGEAGVDVAIDLGEPSRGVDREGCSLGTGRRGGCRGSEGRHSA